MALNLRFFEVSYTQECAQEYLSAGADLYDSVVHIPGGGV